MKAINGQDVGYKRISTSNQHFKSQLLGIHLDREFKDICSGSVIDRPRLKQCLKYMREGDCLHVQSIDRLARNLIDLQNLVDDIITRNISIKFHREDMVFDGNETPETKLRLQTLGAYAEFERNLIKERQREGIDAAKQRGVQMGRRPSLTKKQVENIRYQIDYENATITSLAKKYKVARQTIYRYLSEETT